MNKKWNEKNTLEKAATVISGIALVVWLFLQVLERTTTWAYTNLAIYIAVCVICICEAYSFWKVRRSLSYIAIGGIVCLVAVMILEAM